MSAHKAIDLVVQVTVIDGDTSLTREPIRVRGTRCEHGVVAFTFTPELADELMSAARCQAGLKRPGPVLFSVSTAAELRRCVKHSHDEQRRAADQHIDDVMRKL